jgi:2-methylcitrate dehydratase PrpD
VVETECKIVEFVNGTSFADIPPRAIEIVKDQVLSIVGTTIAGASAEGCETLRDMAREAGGAKEASILIHGGKVPAQQAAFVNAVMARALDFCDAMVPGAHAGAAIVSAALAAAEMVGGVSGADFLAAVCVGDELAIRLNLGEAEYDGFDPTGVCVPFGATAAAARILGLDEEQTRNALGLAFCRCGGSFQANVDGVLAVRVIEGWVAETGVTCARLASCGITGPPNFLDGIYGYFHLFGRDRVTGETVLAGLGADYQVDRLVFKKFPSCGATQAATEMILELAEAEGIGASDIERVVMTVPPYIYKLVGHPFHLGANPKVNAQFSIRYCAANALVRKGSALAHFEADAIRDSEVLTLVERIEAVADPALDARGHTAVDMLVATKNGREYFRQTDVAPGFPEKPLTKEEHLRRFRDCVAFAADPPAAGKVAEIIAAVESIERSDDVRELVGLLLP